MQSHLVSCITQLSIHLLRIAVLKVTLEIAWEPEPLYHEHTEGQKVKSELPQTTEEGASHEWASYLQDGFFKN